MYLEGKEGSKKNVEQVNEVIKKYFSEVEKTRGDRAVYSDSYKANKLEELRVSFTSAIIGLLNRYMTNVQKYEQNVEKQVDLEKLAYIPSGNTEELLFLEKRKDIAQQFKLLKFYEKEQFYQKLLDLNDKERLAMLESSILLLDSSLENDKFKLRVETVQEKRLRPETKQEVNDLKVFFAPLRRTAERILTEIKTSNVLPASAFYSWLHLSGEGSIYSARDIADNLRSSMRGADLANITSIK